jgi:hypothetical protein
MELKKEFFQEADKAIAEFDSIYDFFKVAKVIMLTKTGRDMKNIRNKTECLRLQLSRDLLDSSKLIYSTNV